MIIQQMTHPGCRAAIALIGKQPILLTGGTRISKLKILDMFNSIFVAVLLDMLGTSPLEYLLT